MFAGPHVGLVRRRVGVVRLHRGDDAEPPEARDVGAGDGLDVLDAMAPIAGRVRRRGPLVGVERHPDPAVADRVDLELPAAPIRLGRERVERVRLPFGVAARVVVDVRVEHGRGARLDDAVGVGLEDAGVEPLAAAQVADERLVLVERGRARHRGSAPGASAGRAGPAAGVRPRPGGSATAASSSGSTHASWIAVMPAACIAAIDRRMASSVSAVDGSRDEPGHQVLGVLLERAGRLARRRVADDDPVARVGRRAVDAGGAQGGGVGPAGVAVVAADEGRPVRHHGIEERRASAGRPGTGRTSSPGRGPTPRRGAPRPDGRSRPRWHRRSGARRDRPSRASMAPSTRWTCASSKPAVMRPPRASTTSVAGPRQSRSASSSRPIQAMRPSRTATAVGAATGLGPISDPYGPSSCGR